MRVFYVGGARSGKSRLAAERARALSSSDDVCCIVTALASDDEMQRRIAVHRAERPQSWRVVEEPVQLGAALREADGKHTVVLIDCLTIWTANCLWPDQQVWPREREMFLTSLRDCSSHIVIVSNEVGTGIIPDNAASRVFVDEQGWLNQSVAAVCDEVMQAVVGIGVRIKPAR